jgi:hypothetical protein
VKKWFLLSAAGSSALTLLAVWCLGGMAVPAAEKLDNGKVKVVEVTYVPGAPRERHIRSADQVIVFMDDCKYERTDSTTKEKTVRQRKSGDVIWHDKGEDAPRLVNLGNKPYRTLVIELKSGPPK